MEFLQDLLIIMLDRNGKKARKHYIFLWTNLFSKQLPTNKLIFPSSVSGTPHDLRCKVHMGEKLQLYCETCEVLTCKDCQLSDKHQGHKHRENHEVVPDVKIALNQAVSDVRLKRNVLNEGQAHHMFSRFLNLRIYFNEIYFCFVFLQGI